MKKTLTFVMLIFAMAATANADPVSFNYHFVGGGNVADLSLSGNLLGTSTFKYLITQGTLTVTGGLAAGTYTLNPNPNANGSSFTSLNSGFSGDDTLLRGKNPAVDDWGLMFKAADGSEVNLFTTGGANNYSFYYWRQGDAPGPTYRVMYNGTGSLVDVPEPVTLSMLVAGIACLCSFGMRQNRRQRATELA